MLLPDVAHPVAVLVETGDRLGGKKKYYATADSEKMHIDLGGEKTKRRREKGAAVIFFHAWGNMLSVILR